MRKLLFVFLVFLFSGTTVYSQMTTIACMNPNEFCVGLEPENYAQMQVVTNPPIPLPSNSTMTYIWTVKHESGTSWTWHTNHNYKAIPIPWQGEYTIRVKIHYVQKYQNYPFAAFWSNRVVLIGKYCPTEAVLGRF